MKKKVVREFIFVALSMFLGTMALTALTFWLFDFDFKKLKFVWWILILGWLFLCSVIYAFIHIYILKEHYQRVNQLWKQKSYRQSVYQYLVILLVIKLLIFFIWLFLVQK
ncbi:MAG: hypothetical protein I3273_02025 [Candidatus Moeniiplasma glomeromycotorum]|nr:hypothetical protein [Candidatus Moeniiplasma glomeromycotorum]MCE8167103.1 hypothetical protein [Candidatus Moeniiplasma glomeromycotorum]MCE8168885.1 hypothetical protein [Candidatus Moeniiplasma glomeromycotorum]